jgi:hypothetical protein
VPSARSPKVDSSQRVITSLLAPAGGHGGGLLGRSSIGEATSCHL